MIKPVNHTLNKGSGAAGPIVNVFTLCEGCGHLTNQASLVDDKITCLSCL